MASKNAVVSRLASPLRELVLKVASREEDYGKSDKDRAEVSDWILKVATGEVVHPSSAKGLDNTLAPKTYLVSNYLTAADVALYGALHPVLSQLSPEQYYGHPALTRYFNHIQSRSTVRQAADALSPAFSFVTFDLDNMPKVERKIESSKKRDKTPKPTPSPATSSTTFEAVAAESRPEGLARKDKEKKNAKEKSTNAAVVPAQENTKKVPSTASEESGEPIPSMIDLRVGYIVDIKKHPDADSLYIEQIDLGEETGPRTVVSGLVNYIPIEEMREKHLVAVCNLKPANMRGVKSFAMVLCATSKDGKEGGIELIQPPRGSKPGDRVYFEGEKYENAQPLSQLNPKKKIFETIQPGFTTLETHEAAWVDPATKSVHRIRTANGVCTAPTLVGASLS